MVRTRREKVSLLFLFWLAAISHQTSLTRDVCVQTSQHHRIKQRLPRNTKALEYTHQAKMFAQFLLCSTCSHLD
eukprot:scaffold1928_cov109-Alexandrium_tamarense.AAC.41